MKTLPSALQTHLNSGATTLCTCWRIQRGDGQVFGFTNHDKVLSFGGDTYQPESGFTPSEMASSLGLAIDTMEVEGALSSEIITEDDIALGLWDNADAEIWRVNWADTDQRVILRKGSLGEITRGEVAFQTEIRGLAHHLNQERGRTYQRPCDAVVGDARCGVDLTDPAFAGTGTVVSAIDGKILAVSGLDAFDSGWFSRGLLTWTSGANDGGKIEVAAHAKSGANVGLTLWQRAALAIAPGDEFAVTAGCGKSFSICRDKFDNAVNHRGFPHIPGNDFALSVAKRGGNNDGTSLFND